MLLASMLTRGAIATPTDQLGATQAKDVPRIGLRVAAQIHETKRSRVPCTGAGHRLKQRQNNELYPARRKLKIRRRRCLAPFYGRKGRRGVAARDEVVGRFEEQALIADGCVLRRRPLDTYEQFHISGWGVVRDGLDQRKQRCHKPFYRVGRHMVRRQVCAIGAVAVTAGFPGQPNCSVIEDRSASASPGDALGWRHDPTA